MKNKKILFMILTIGMLFGEYIYSLRGLVLIDNVTFFISDQSPYHNNKNFPYNLKKLVAGYNNYSCGNVLRAKLDFYEFLNAIPLKMKNHIKKASPEFFLMGEYMNENSNYMTKEFRKFNPDLYQGMWNVWRQDKNVQDGDWEDWFSKQNYLKLKEFEKKIIEKRIKKQKEKKEPKEDIEGRRKLMLEKASEQLKLIIPRPLKEKAKIPKILFLE